MGDWKYLKVECDYDHDFYRVKRVNGVELPNWKMGPPDVEYANQLGADGWELVSSHPASGAYVHSFALWFKRPSP